MAWALVSGATFRRFDSDVLETGDISGDYAVSCGRTSAGCRAPSQVLSGLPR